MIYAGQSSNHAGYLGRHGLRGVVVGFAALILVASATAQAAEAGARKDGEVVTAFYPQVDRPLLCTVDATWKGSMQMTKPGGAESVGIDRIRHLRFVDTHTLLEDGREQGSRRWLIDQLTEHGKIADTMFTGFEAGFDCVGDEVRARVLGDRSCGQADLRMLCDRFSSLGMWIPLPETSKVGERMVVDLSGIIGGLSTDTIRNEVAQGNLALKSYDGESQSVAYCGDATFQYTSDLGMAGMETTVRFQGACELAVSVAEARIVSLNLDGKFELEGADQNRQAVRGEGRYRVSLKTAIGREVTKALSSRPKFRKRTYVAPQLGVELVLPAHYRQLPAQPGVCCLLRTVHASKGEVLVQLEWSNGDSSDARQAYAALAAEFDEAYPGVRNSAVKSPMGYGRAFVVTKPAAGKKAFQMEFYPWRGGFLIYKIVGDPVAVQKAMSEFKSGRKTLKPVADS